MRLLLLLASAAAISKVPKAPTAGRKAAQAQATQAKPLALTGGAKQKQAVQPLAIAGGGNKKQVSYAWAVLHNWLYFLSLGLCIPVLPKVIARPSTTTARRSSRRNRPESRAMWKA